MKYLSILFILLFFGVSQLFSQNMNENIQRSMFSDPKASQVGDAVTILIVEQSSAENEASTKAARDSKISLSGSASLPNGQNPSVSGAAGSGNNFQGSGNTISRGTITAKISAKIMEVDDNGNLKIQGLRKIKVNDEEQTIEIKGSIRPHDILADNSIYSYKISDAEITFKGDGIVSSAQGPGWITKLIRWLF